MFWWQKGKDESEDEDEQDECENEGDNDDNVMRSNLARETVSDDMSVVQWQTNDDEWGWNLFNLISCFVSFDELSLVF